MGYNDPWSRSSENLPYKVAGEMLSRTHARKGPERPEPIPEAELTPEEQASLAFAKAQYDLDAWERAKQQALQRRRDSDLRDLIPWIDGRELDFVRGIQRELRETRAALRFKAIELADEHFYAMPVKGGEL